MTAPSEAEIREAIEADRQTWMRFSDAFSALTLTVDRLYDTEALGPCEVEDLDLSDEVMAIYERARAEVTEALVRGALAFAARHPDAPRAVREPVTA